MKNDITVTNPSVIENRIFVIRNVQVMIDSDIAELYGEETKRINQAVKRNLERFPEEFCFQLTESENEFLRSQNATSKIGENVLRSQIATSKKETRGGRQYLPYAFTEQGVAMLSAILRSETAVKVSIQIMNAFVAMRKFLASNAQVFTRLDKMERHQLESDQKIDELFTRMEQYGEEPRQGIFFQGQIFDSYAFFEKLVQKAKKQIVLIDGYIDLTVLERLSKKRKGVQVAIYTNAKTKVSPLDVQKFNEQYPTLTLNFTDKMHDRFLIIDNSELYHIGASVKDLGKKCFAFQKMQDVAIGDVMKHL